MCALLCFCCIDVNNFLTDFADNSPDPNLHCKGCITPYGDRNAVFGGARFKSADELDVNMSLTCRYADVYKILASASQMCNEGKHCWWLDGDGGYIVPQDGAIGRDVQAGMNRPIHSTSDQFFLQCLGHFAYNAHSSVAF